MKLKEIVHRWWSEVSTLFRRLVQSVDGTSLSSARFPFGDGWSAPSFVKVVTNSTRQTGASFYFFARLLVVSVLIAQLATGAWADAPGVLNYQGKLTNQDGSPITATPTMEFRIYDASTGGTLLYTYGSLTVPVDNGVFNVQIGSNTAVSGGAIPKTVFQGGTDRWLEIVVAGETLSPRERLTAAPYALAVATNSVGANEIVNGSVAIGDLNVASVETIFLSTGTPQTITATKTFSGATLLGLPNPPPQADAAASKAYVDAQVTGSGGWSRDSGNSEVELSNVGDQVGIGTSAPDRKLHIASTNDQLVIEDTDAGTDYKKWMLKADGATMELVTADDGFNNFQA
ncbi:MAG TPA: hypothetical protein P5079_08455, partial [Elusimicrobiota bacterium]|nr:hypothetical protein [Elusimicrobiota bacterium]